jgi:hypothetical protein
MRTQGFGSRKRCVMLELVQLEDRLAPSVTTDYIGHSYPNSYGDEYLGTHTPVVTFITPDLEQHEVDLVPADPMPTSTWSGSFQNALKSFPKWTFTFSKTPLQGSLAVQTYAAFGNGYGDPLGIGAVPRVGAELDLTYEPKGKDPTKGVYWIQVVTTNCPTSGQIGPTVTYVDNGGNKLSPIYPGDGKNIPDGRGFYDVPTRPITGKGIQNGITWSAEVYLVVADPKAGKATIYPDGIRWGWQLVTRGEKLIPTVDVSGAPNPSVELKPFTVTATVNGLQGQPAPTGLVSFVWDKNGGPVLEGTATLSKAKGGIYQATFEDRGFGDAGQYRIFASYNGDTNYWGANSNDYTQTVKQAQGVPFI